MKTTNIIARRLFQITVLLCALSVSQSAWGDWPQWGGPDRNFIVETSGLADSWPEDGPKRLWHRRLGYGYSGIAYDGGVLYTMYRRKNTDNYEYAIALDAVTGKTIWQKRNLATVPKETLDYGKQFTGPNATPLIVGDRLFTLGRNAMLHCFQKTDGTILWKHKLHKDFGAQLQTCGYSCSPLAYRNTIILPLGRTESDTSEGNSLVAFDQASGDVVWRSQTFQIEHASPILITHDGQEQCVVCTRRAVIGVNPANGDLLWEFRFPPGDFSGIFSTPVWDGKDTIFFSARKIGCAIRLVDGDSGATPELLWSNEKAPLGMATPVLLGDMLVGSKQGDVNAPLLGVDVGTGERLWLDRNFRMTVSIGGDDRLIVLDHSGQLGLVTATRAGLTIRSQCQLTERESFTAPTLVGTTLYVRDEKHIMALDLG